MIVTDSTLVGYTMINGTWGLQMALFIAALFNYFINPDPLDLNVATQLEIDSLHFLRSITIPLTHVLLMIMCFIVNSERI
jgi:dimeric dUTPase (all-alpha-NTP-PPase superfamily)